MDRFLGEAFALPYRLSNRNNYNETCAAIALAKLAEELQRQEVNSEYADVIERILYNAMLSGISLEGDAFFYENAPEIDLRDYDISTRAFKPMAARDCHERGLLHSRRLQRSRLFTCSCCPPNIARIMASVARYMYTIDGNSIYCHQFTASKTSFTINNCPATLEQETNYPVDGRLRFSYHGSDALLAIRIPDWCREYSGTAEQGYARFAVTDGSVVEIELPMNIHFMEAAPDVCECAGKYTVMRGPIVYCMESVDNGKRLWDTRLESEGASVSQAYNYCGVPILEVEASRRAGAEKLYQGKSDERERFVAKLIPYFAFANRGISDMKIWTQSL